MDSQILLQFQCFNPSNYKVYSSTLKLNFYEPNEQQKFSQIILGLKDSSKYKIDLHLLEIKESQPAVQLTKYTLTYFNNYNYDNELYHLYLIASYFGRKSVGGRGSNTYNKMDDALFVFIARMLKCVRFDSKHDKIATSNEHLCATWNPRQSLTKYATIIFGEFIRRRSEQLFQATFRIDSIPQRNYYT